MRKKKVLVHGTAESLEKFSADAVNNDFDIVAILSDDEISVEVDDEEVEILSTQNLPKTFYKLVDGIIMTDAIENKKLVKFFLKQGFEPRKIILWDEQQGWGNLDLRDADGTRVIYFYGLEFHLRDNDDVNFFNEIFWRLDVQRQVKNLSPESYPAVLGRIFQERRGRPLDLDNPKTFTEKIQWLKIFDATPIKSRLADKYLVRNWVAEKIGEQYLIPLLGVWDDFDDIDFDALPDQFVLKCNHGCGMNIIVRDKKNFDVERAREKINAWLAVDWGAQRHLELHYTRINRKIIAEKFMTDGDAPDLTDYKFGCFNGKVPYCKATTERSAKIRCDYFDMNWQHMNFERNDYPNNDHPERIPRPKNFELMKKLAATLSEGFAFVRVDFYEIGGRVYFGEMTFTPAAGSMSYKSEETDEFLGSLLKLPKPSLPPELY